MCSGQVNSVGRNENQEQQNYFADSTFDKIKFKNLSRIDEFA